MHDDVLVGTAPFIARRHDLSFVLRETRLKLKRRTASPFYFTAPSASMMSAPSRIDVPIRVLGFPGTHAVCIHKLCRGDSYRAELCVLTFFL